MEVDINDFTKELECDYKEDHYSVRDNGAVLRHARKGKRLRKDDDIWTFGKPNNYAYMLIGSEVVHRIVATAFHGPAPTTKHIVDHIDTNRKNNRPENLRWLTKFENILKNPITINRIIYHCGSIDAFLKDPSILKKYIKEDPNFEWMRTVTPEEAKISWDNLSKLATWKNTKKSSDGRPLGEWVFKNKSNNNSIIENSEFTTSLTTNAIQKNWKIPSEFPLCPQEGINNSIDTYKKNLIIGEVFSNNKYSKFIIVNFALGKDKNSILVLSKSNDKNAVKPWSLARLTIENNLFVHENLGSFFMKTGAEKQFTLEQGLEWIGDNSIDDLT